MRSLCGGTFASTGAAERARAGVRPPGSDLARTWKGSRRAVWGGRGLGCDPVKRPALVSPQGNRSASSPAPAPRLSAARPTAPPCSLSLASASLFCKMTTRPARSLSLTSSPHPFALSMKRLRMKIPRHYVATKKKKKGPRGTDRAAHGDRTECCNPPPPFFVLRLSRWSQNAGGARAAP